MYVSAGASVNIMNSTFVGNVSEEVGGAVLINDGASFISNSIFTDNLDSSPGQVSANVLVTSGVVTANYSSFQGGWSGPGTGNIDADPLFVNADGPDDIIGTEDDDLRLYVGSPCIDAGDSSAAIAAGLTTDINALPRFIDEPLMPDTGVGPTPIVDMGAHEYAASLLAPPIIPPAPHDRRKNRYLSFSPQTGGVLAAHRAAKVTPPTGECWVGAPDANDRSNCVSAPVYRTWSESVVHVGDCAVTPVSDYEIAASVDAAAFTSPLLVSTIALPSNNNKYWADVAGINNGTEWTAPNQFSNVQDIVALLAYVTSAAVKPTFEVANLQAVSSNDPCLNDFVNTADIFICVKAVAGDPYPFTTDPAKCPACP